MSAAENFNNSSEGKSVKLDGTTVGNKVDYNASAGQGGYDRAERPKVGAMEVVVEHNIEKAMRVLKRKLIKEGLFKELKARRYYEKPSVRRKRKEKESAKKVRKEEARAKKNPMLLA